MTICKIWGVSKVACFNTVNVDRSVSFLDPPQMRLCLHVYFHVDSIYLYANKEGIKCFI